MYEATIVVTGNLTSDPRTSRTVDGVARTTFGLAHTARNRGRDGVWVDSEVTYYQVTCWAGLAEHVGVSVRKGHPVIVQGTVRSRKWESGEREGSSLDIRADVVGHDLNRGDAVFARPTRALPEGEPGNIEDDVEVEPVESGHPVVADSHAA